MWFSKMFLLRRMAGWSLFLAAMFIGMGIGMIFDAAGAGTIIGLGVGFLLIGLFGEEESSKEEGVSDSKLSRSVSKSRFLHSIPLIIIGLGFIIGGLTMAGFITIPEYVYKYLGALIIIIIGLSFLVAGLYGSITRKKESIQSQLFLLRFLFF